MFIFEQLLFNGTLDSHLADIDEQAQSMFERLIEQMPKSEGVTEQLKEKNQLLWVEKMNMVKEQATEIVNHDLIRA